MIRKCLTCNKEFRVRPSYIRKGGGKYCSHKCQPAWNKGKSNAMNYAKNLGNYAQKGAAPWNKGLSDERTRYYRPTIFKRGQNKNEKHWAWKGDRVGYDALHDWVKRNCGRATCCSFDPSHKATFFHWANISGSYLRDVGDWTSLCPKCHRQYDILRGKFYSRERRAGLWLV